MNTDTNKLLAVNYDKSNSGADATFVFGLANVLPDITVLNIPIRQIKWHSQQLSEHLIKNLDV